VLPTISFWLSFFEAKPEPCSGGVIRQILPLAKKGEAEPRTTVRGKEKEIVGRKSDSDILFDRRPHSQFILVLQVLKHFIKLCLKEGSY